jgi:N-acetylglucosamine repressor
VATVSRYLGREPSAEESRQMLHQQELTMAELISRARTGDERALAALVETGRYMGVGLAMIVNALNPARIIVGGEITAAWDLILDELSRVVAARALTPAAAQTHIIPEQTSEHPRLRGATALIAAPLFAAPQVA